MGSIKDNLSEIRNKIDKAAKKVDRDSKEITLWQSQRLLM